MIYGVTIILNDCDFRLKNRDSQVKERYSFEAFFTNRTAAMQSYYGHLQRVKNEKVISYGRYELRGRCELYKAEINAGMVMNHGKTILQEPIK